jgi:hypothetical protein
VPLTVTHGRRRSPVRPDRDQSVGRTNGPQPIWRILLSEHLGSWRPHPDTSREHREIQWIFAAFDADPESAINNSEVLAIRRLAARHEQRVSSARRVEMQPAGLLRRPPTSAKLWT